MSVRDDLGDDTTAHIAVIGMACRLPGAADPGTFWRNLIGGVDTITRLPEQPVPGRGANGSGAQYVPARGLIKDPEWFDAGYFGYTPREARLISPQHRVFLECGVEALEDAGYDPARYSGAIGVYAGGTETGYAQILKSQRATLPSVTDFEILLANGADFLVSRLAYKLGLRGPAVTVQAACATALVAAHLAIQALLSGDCDLALAGGIAVHVPAKYSPYAKGGILSADGTCRTFDAAADGTVGSDGAGLVVLKRLADALADGDHIHAVVRGSAVNNDGSGRVGFTAPSIDGQAAVIRDAQLIAGVDAGTITCLEAHGTATPLGDPIEIAALTKAFRHDTDRTGFCQIGSVKSNIGHTDTAAGAAGLIKMAMAVQHGLIPPSLHFSEPNPGIDFDASPFRVATSLAEWRPEGLPRRAGVSSFGIGGTNAHLVLEEPPKPAPPGESQPWQLLVLSAGSASALDAVTARLADHLRAHPELPFADVAWTLQVGRREQAHRRYAIASSLADAAAALADPGHERLVTSAGSPRARPVAFMFPGADSSCRQTARLYQTEPEFRRRVDECCDSAPELSAATQSVLRSGKRPGDPVTAALIVFAREYALARMWIQWGVRPAAVLGTGTGALVAATVGGVFAVPDAVGLVLARARLADRSSAGSGSAESAADKLGKLVRAAGPGTPEIRIVSERRGQWLSPGEAADPAYWAGQQREAAYLDDAVSALLADPGYTLIEVGAGHTLTALAGRRPEFTADHLAVASLTGTGEGAGAPPSMHSALGRVWLAGTPISWAGVRGEERRARVPLPTYPFERQRYIVEPDASFQAFGAVSGGHPAADAPTAAAESAGRPEHRDGGDAPGPDAPGPNTLGVLTGLFAHLLELPDVHPDDSFFDLGADSLMVADLLTDLDKALSVDLDMQSVYDAPTATALAALIDEQLAGRKIPQPTT